jgi:hypothetical protein
MDQIGVTMGYMSQAIATQAGIMGFRDSFLIIGVLFLGCLLPAWFMPHVAPGAEPQSTRPMHAPAVSKARLESELLIAAD